MKPLVYSSAAREDIQAERDYYAGIYPDLGHKFLSAVERAAEMLRAQPEAMQVIDRHIRRWPVDGFEHGILYRVAKTHIYVLAIFHPKQNPAKWRKRIGRD